MRSIACKISLLVTLIGSLLFASCANDPTSLWKGEGSISLTFKGDHDATAKASPQDVTYKVEIVDSEGAIAASFPDHNNVPDKIKLKAGTYLVRATNGADGNAGFEAPYYKGEQMINVSSGKNLAVEIVCKLANVAVTVVYADVVKDNFNKYVVTVTNESGGVLVFDEAETKIGYFKNSGKLTWTINLANKNGLDFNMVSTIRDVKPREHYILNYVINPDGEDKPDIEYDDNLNEQKHNIDLILNRKPKPFITGKDFDLNKNVPVSYGNQRETILDITAEGGVYYLSVSHNSPNLQNAGLPTNFNIFDLTPAAKSSINALGINWSEPMGGALSATLDFSVLTAKLPIGEYAFDLVLLDHHNQLVKQRLNIVVADVDVTSGDVDVWAKFATFKGSWTSAIRPEGIGFEYKKASDEGWIAIPESELTVSGNKFEVLVKNLEPHTDYEMRATSTKATASILAFTTEMADQLPNFNFDGWYKSGKSWYANTASDNFFWDSGNEGANVNPFGETNPTYPEENHVVKGKAAMLKTQTVVGVMAAGSIYSGKFGGTIGTSGAKLNFGRPYTGRPVSLKGYYDYRPVKVNKGNQNGMSGKMDMCHIYVILTDWNAPFQVNTVDKIFIDVENDPGIIAYGELSTDQATSDYISFEIPLTYRNFTRKPKHVVVVASASRYGDYFTGGDGSTLYVDEFSFEFDPK